jgi:hypothetical protein
VYQSLVCRVYFCIGSFFFRHFLLKNNIFYLSYIFYIFIRTILKFFLQQIIIISINFFSRQFFFFGLLEKKSHQGYKEMPQIGTRWNCTQEIPVWFLINIFYTNSVWPLNSQKFVWKPHNLCKNHKVFMRKCFLLIISRKLRPIGREFDSVWWLYQPVTQISKKNILPQANFFFCETELFFFVSLNIVSFLFVSRFLKYSSFYFVPFLKKYR